MKLLGIKNIFKEAPSRIINLCSYGSSALLPYRPMNGSKETLETEYSSGTWDYLGGTTELARFSIVVGYCHYFKAEGTILELGCGEGILKDRLCPLKYSRYLGVDISSEAIHRASYKQDEKSSFVREDARIYNPDQRFDVIVFNECLEYFQDPLSLVRRYQRFLEKKGVFIVSMFVGRDTVRSKRIWKILEAVYSAEAETRVSTKPGYSWNIKVFMPAKQTY
jgi:2-polyprenyl-6-hydroxyphenyl methylase/3-demethylubiquinone-9 3-methyltransferase